MDARRALLLTLLPAALLLGATAGCSTYSEKVKEFRVEYGAGNFPEAEQTVDRLLAKASGVDAEEVAKKRGLNGVVDPKSGDVPLLLLDKAMARLANGDPATAVQLFRLARNEFDDRLKNSATSNALRTAASVVTDDTMRKYVGADYEHVMIRIMLALCDLASDGGDAYAYALQVGEIQEQILQMAGDEQAGGYNPREKYRRIALGAYLQGILREGDLASDEAVFAFQRAIQYGGETPFLAAALARAKEGRYAPAGCGVLHVFYLGGRGPFLVETHQRATEAARLIVTAVMGIATGKLSAVFQAPVPVPALARDAAPPRPLTVQTDGGAATTETLLDVVDVAREQLDANLAGVMARALIRRVIKAGAAIAAETAIERGTERKRDRDRGEPNILGAILGILGGAAVNVAATATENADTRSWTSLPGQIQVARLELPAGRHDVSFGGGMRATVVISRGRDAFAVVLQPNGARPGTVIVDPRSVAAPPPAPTPRAPASAPTSIPTGELPPAAPPEGPATAPEAPAAARGVPAPPRSASKAPPSHAAETPDAPSSVDAPPPTDARPGAEPTRDGVGPAPEHAPDDRAVPASVR